MPKHFMDIPKPTIAQIILREKKMRSLTLADITSYYKSVVIKTVWFYIKIDTQINETENKN